MKTVIILRHAKSDWSDTALRDFDRGLNERGFRAAAVMGRWAAVNKLDFEAVIASPAVRVVETLRRFGEAYGDHPEPAFDLRIYLATGATIAEVLSETDEHVSRLLLAGRDPAVVDAVAARLMGFDPLGIPIVAHAFEPHRWPITGRSPASIRVHDGRLGRELALSELAPAIPGGFTPHFGWSGLRGAA